jgi:hypothetical protein
LGKDAEGAPFGDLREAHGAVERIDAVSGVTDAFRVRGDDFGTCDGDSGGPAHLAIDDGEQVAWRVAGILSGSTSDSCSAADAWYTPIHPYLSWIEAISKIDVTPCGDAVSGQWAPNPDCVSWHPGRDVLAGETPASTCGEAGPALDGDKDAPRVELRPIDVRADQMLELLVSATDAGVGVRSVSVGIYRSGALVWAKTLGMAPYLFSFRVERTGDYEIVVRAEDFAGNVGGNDMRYSHAAHEEPSCMMRGPMVGSPLRAWIPFFLMTLLARRMGRRHGKGKVVVLERRVCVPLRLRR